MGVGAMRCRCNEARWLQVAGEVWWQNLLYGGGVGGGGVIRRMEGDTGCLPRVDHGRRGTVASRGCKICRWTLQDRDLPHAWEASLFAVLCT